MSDVLIVGGGVIGLSLAYELAGHGAQVRVIDAGQPGREASWAGAGILPPAAPIDGDPLAQLTALSNTLHRDWAQTLRATTGIDNGYRRCGAIYLEREAQAAARLQGFARLALSHDIACERLAANELCDREPSLRPQGDVCAAYLVPGECQIRNPRHLQALLFGCARRGVEITAGAAAEEFTIRGERIESVQTCVGTLLADRVCITSGSWTGPLVRRLGVAPAIKPIRGQMVLFRTTQPILSRIVNEGSRYLVPRDDGRLLAGSTEEDVGYDRSTTAGAIAGLIEFAIGRVPELAQAAVERTWAGLRPATADGLPYIGCVPGLENAFVAAGHFRGGLQLSTGTAVVMSQLLQGLDPDVELSAFALDRPATDALPRRAARSH
ncbi:MAG: glycine oxidase ThiO [Pirellulales bacterium]